MKKLAEIKLTSGYSSDNETVILNRIDYLYSLGYVYNPYSQDFYNPFVQRGLKETCAYNLNEQQIQNVNDQFIEDRGGSVLEIGAIESVFLTPQPHWIFGVLTALIPFLSMAFLVTSLVFNILGYYITSSILVCISYLFLNTFIVENTTHEEINLIDVYPLWSKYRDFIPTIFLLHLPYLYYLLVNSLDNYWKPFIVLFLLYFVASSFLHRKIVNRLAKNYFSRYNWGELEAFAKKQPLN